MLLRTEQLTKDYGNCRALDSLDIAIKPGEIFGLLGPNGSGKSTALRLLLGFLRPTSGHAWIDGHDCWRQSVQARRQVGYLPGDLRLYENMTGRQLVHFLGRLRKTTHNGDEAKLARSFDIDLDRPIAELSSGMKRKVALLLVLLPRTPLLILDEPTNTLDPTMRDELLDQLAAARDQGQAVLFSSHVLAEVERVCDRVGILQKGRLVHLQGVDHLQQAKQVRAVLGVPHHALPDFPGVRSVVRHVKEWTFEYAGPVNELLTWLAGLGVEDVKIEPLGLAGIYHKYHGNGA
jgi:ABC-2 type transport system ATP-binding protein